MKTGSEIALFFAVFLTGIVVGLCGGVYIEKDLAQKRESEKRFVCGYALMQAEKK
jgi:hypothetical protein